MLTNLAQLHDAMLAGLRSKLSGQLSVDAYPTGSPASLPALQLELADMTSGTDPRTGETALVGRFQARVVVDPNQSGAQLTVRELAAKVVQALQHETWGLGIGMAKPGTIAKDESRAELNAYLVWMVEWRHEFHLGQVVWPYEDQSNIALMLGLYPETGPGNEADYWVAGEVPQ